MNRAPILLFVYNRPWHTHQVIEALKNNALAPESDLFVYADAPKHTDDTLAVAEVRDIVRGIEGFKSVSITERSENYGLSRSIITGVTEVVQRFGRVIVLEDDLVTSPHFLTFMNTALEYYHDDERVVSVHGYMYPVAGQLPETFFLKDTGSWGWATWQRGWDLFVEDGARLLAELRKQRLIRAFDMDGAHPFSRILQDQVDGKNDSWAIRWQAAAFLRNGLTLFPGRSLVNNIGFDGSGVHCGSSKRYESPLTQQAVTVGTSVVEEHREVLELLKTYFRSVQPNIYIRTGIRLKQALLDLFSTHRK